MRPKQIQVCYPFKLIKKDVAVFLTKGFLALFFLLLNQRNKDTAAHFLISLYLVVARGLYRLKTCSLARRGKKPMVTNVFLMPPQTTYSFRSNSPSRKSLEI